MTKQTEALRMALAYFEVEKNKHGTNDHDYIIQTCKEALAEAEKSDKEIVSEFWNNFKEL